MPPRSGHQRIKAVGYDDDDDDIYSDENYYSGDEGGDGMSPEDQEQMRQGTLKVKEALDSQISVPDTEIQEALWHYYFDVGKSVTYLKNKHAPSKAASQPKKQKASSRFDQAAGAAQTKSTTGEQTNVSYILVEDMKAALPLDAGLGAIRSYPAYPTPMIHHAPLTAADFFRDTPWLNVPAHRFGEITVESLYPRGRLLGGSSSKPSKLAALVAARKKKQEEGKSAVPPMLSDKSNRIEADRAVSLLDRLSVKDKEGIPVPIGQKDESVKPEMPKRLQSRYTSQKKQSRPPPKQPEKQFQAPETEVEFTLNVPDLRASPSIFAATMIGISRSGPPKPMLEGSSYPLPYAHAKGFADSNPFSGPSPDDVVINAQTKGNKAKKGPSTNKTTDGDKANGLADSVSSLSVDDAPKVKSKNLNVLEEFEKSNMKRMANFVVIGHVDHGKSTLMGRLLYDLKVIDQRSVDKLRKEAETIGKSSFALAWVMDQTSEERSRGVTVDIATNYFETSRTRFTILDAPGHRDFIPNMIAGASQADFAVLVIDAGINSFESGLRGQTKEHALLVRSMGVQRLVIAVNKMDTVSWDQGRFEEISQQMTAFLVSASFSAKNLTFVPCAGLTGENIMRAPSEGTIPGNWYHGPTLVEALDASEPAKRALELPLRLTISDVFRGGIMNPVSISGRLDAGSLQVGDFILAMPSGESATVKGIEVETEPVDWAVSGQIPTLHLQGIDPIHLRLGDILCTPTSPIKNTRSFTSKILAFEHVIPMSVDVFRGRMHASGRVVKLLAVLNKQSGVVEKKNPRVVQPAAVARVVVELEKEMPLEKGTRVVLRAEGNTIAAGLLENA